MGRKTGGRGKKKKKRGANKKLTSGSPGRDNEPEKQDNRLTLPPPPGYEPLILFKEGYDEDDLAGVVPFGIGTRVEIVDGYCLPEGVRTIGTVTGHWMEVKFGEREGAAHTSIRTDCGRPIHVMAESTDCIVESDAPPLRPIYKVGSRIECQLQENGGWFPGTIVNVHPDWVEKDWYPYRINFDDGSSRPFWGPQDCIRSCNKTLSQKKRPTLRFKPGDRVSCYCGVGEDGWLDGTVIKLWYRERVAFADDFVAPYSIQLDQGRRIYAPADSDACIMRSSAPAPECWICFDNEQSESNLIIRGCVCRGTNNGFVHIDCLVKLAQTKVEERDLDRDELNPFFGCITCRAPFGVGSPCCLALAEAGYEAYKSRDLNDSWNQRALRKYAHALASEDRFDDALNLLNERIALLRVVIVHANKDDNPYWRLDLADFLLELAGVYDDMDCLPEMKSAVDESLSITGSIQEVKLVGHRDSALYLLAKYAYGTGDKNAALEHLEEATRGDRIDVDALLSCGNLNLECGNKERGLGQLSLAVRGLSKCYGNDSSRVCTANKYIQSIEQGIMEKMPSHGLRVLLS